jgi:two-component system, chemotaxis family, protein-glutamate methylesterase/glutaminase
VDTEVLLGRRGHGSESRPAVVALVASAGGFDAIASILGSLDPGLPASVLVLVHLLPERRSLLPELLARRTSLQVKQAEEGDVLEDGWVYVAGPNAHLVVTAEDTLRLDSGAPVHHARPAADVLLTSLPAACGGNCLAVVLTGAGTDGAAGARAVKAAGGRVLAQDESSSAHFGMPSAAIATGSVDDVLPLEEIAPAITAFASGKPAHR